MRKRGSVPVFRQTRFFFCCWAPGRFYDCAFYDIHSFLFIIPTLTTCDVCVVWAPPFPSAASKRLAALEVRAVRCKLDPGFLKAPPGIKV